MDHPAVYHYMPQFLPMFTITHSMFTITCLNVNQCSPLHTQYLPMFTNVYQCLQLQAPMLNITVVNNTCLPLNPPKQRSTFCRVQESGIVANNMHHTGAIFL